MTKRKETDPLLLRTQAVAIARGDALIRIQTHCMRQTLEKVPEGVHILAMEIAHLIGDYFREECKTLEPELQWKVRPKEGAP